MSAKIKEKSITEEPENEQLPEVCAAATEETDELTDTAHNEENQSIGNEEAADAEETVKGLDEVLREFPELRSKEDLPSEVIAAAEEKKSNYFDEYLRYLHRQQQQIIKAKQQNESARAASVGSQSRFVGEGISPSAEEFIKGLWS